MKCNITFHGVLNDFIENLTPRTRSAILRDLVYYALFEGDRERLYVLLRKYEDNERAQKPLEVLPEPHYNSPSHTQTGQERKSIAKSLPKPQVAPVPKSEYSEEGTASIEELRNEFDMTL